MALARHLIHTCTTRRPDITLDELNQRKTVMRDWLTDEPCRLVVKDQRNPFGALAADPVVESDVLLMGAEADVREGDEIADILFDDGTIDPGPYRIESIRVRRARRVHHKSLMLERVK